jgi:pimeloyl-ACP methyl ester carboxylesterase
MSAMFRDEQARARIEAAYERFRARAPEGEDRTLKTRFGDTHALVAGREGAPPMVLLHGALASSAHVLPEVAPLLERFRVHAVDVIGQSVKSADTRLKLDGADYGEWLVDVLDGLGLPRAHLYGVSWGGFVARKLAEVAPDRIDRLALLVPAGFVGGPVWRGFTEVAMPLAMYRMFPSDARLRRFVSAIMSPPLDDAWIEWFAEVLRSYRLDMRVPPLATDAMLTGFARPTLVIGAAHDLSFPGAALIARAKTLLPHAETELLEDSRHSPPMTEAYRQRLCDRVARFLLAEAATTSISGDVSRAPS